MPAVETTALLAVDDDGVDGYIATLNERASGHRRDLAEGQMHVALRVSRIGGRG